jgi:hypothetical protein
MKKLILITTTILLPVLIKAAEPSVLINEIAWMGTENSNTDEWLELYNNTNEEIDLTGWKLEADDGSPKINLEGVIPAGGYALLERTDDETVSEITADQIYTGSLSNSGEWLKLYNADNNLIDEINNSEEWLGGDNSTKQTLERTDLTSWQTGAEPGGTPKATNSIKEPSEEETPPAEPQPGGGSSSTPTDTSLGVKKGDIIINEVFPNPTGIDLDQEFIEIKNISKTVISLKGWKITNAAKQNFILPSLTMSPKSIVVFYRQQTDLALNNNKEKITLHSKSGLIINRVEYKSPAPEDKSYQRNEAGKCSWDEISPGKDNLALEIILPKPIIYGPKEARVGEVVTFDASDSFDPEGRELSFVWTFDDKETIKGITVSRFYYQSGNYEAKKFKIKIIEPREDIQATTTPPITPETMTLEEIPFIFISEFLPNPKGPDGEGEFIEIFSNHDKPVNLAGWQLDDAEGGSKPYTIPGTVIKPGQFLAFFRTETKIALNNSDEAVRLLAPDNTLVDYTDYEKSKEGVSFVLDENFSWQQSQTPTPGEINTLDETEEEEEEEKKTEPKVLGVETKEIVKNNEPQNKTKYFVSAISAITILGLGTVLKIKKKG